MRRKGGDGTGEEGILGGKIEEESGWKRIKEGRLTVEDGGGGALNNRAEGVERDGTEEDKV
jgi:hypothetical protein